MTKLGANRYGKQSVRLVRIVRGPVHRVRDLTVAFAPAEVRSKQPGADAVIANGLISRYDCVFDYGGKRLYLRPRSGAGGQVIRDPFVVSTSKDAEIGGPGGTPRVFHLW